MNKLMTLILWASLASSAAAASAAPLMTILIRAGKMSEARGGNIDITLSIPQVAFPADTTFLRIGTRVPGMARSQPVRDLVVTDADGPARMIARSTDDALQWSAVRALAGKVTVHYRIPLENIPLLAGGPATQLRIDGDGFSGKGSMLIAMPQITAPYRIAIQWDLDAMGGGARGVSSYGDGNVHIPAGPIARINDMAFMAGTMKRYVSVPFEAVWTGTPNFDPYPTMQWVAALHGWMSKAWRAEGEGEPPYRVFLRFDPMNAGTGSSLHHSFIATYGKGVTGDSLKAILAHEMTHTFTAGGATGMWYNEGIAVYYGSTLLMPWLAGLTTTDEFLNHLNEVASTYYTDVKRDLPEDQVPPDFWKDTRIRMLPYDRGAMYFATLNAMELRASHGRRLIGDLIRVMSLRTQTGKPSSEAVWIGLLRKELGAAGPGLHRKMMAGRLIVPPSDAFGPCFRRVIRRIPMFDLGFAMKSLSLVGPKVIQGLKPGSHAAQAGLRNGDEVSYAATLDFIQSNVHDTLTLHVLRDGRTFDLTYLPRGRPVDAYQWVRVPGVPESECRSPYRALLLATRGRLHDPAGTAAPGQGDLDLVAVGDLLYSHPFAAYPDLELQQVLQLLRSADVVIGNKEGVFFDLRDFEGSRNGDGLLWGESALGRDMKSMGIDMVSVANNHSMDWGWQGLRASLHLLDEAGVVYAGAGRNLRAAREAGVLRTPKGVVALVGTTSTFRPNAGAMDPFEDLPARPGISVLHVRKVNLITRSQMGMIRRLAARRASRYEPAPDPGAREVYFGGEPYRVSNHPGLHYAMDPDDLAGLLQAVRTAKRHASLVVFTIHAHETATGEDDDNPTPPDFLIELAHEVIDAGADVFLGTGIHDLRGIEIYKGRPVLYGMSSFFINGEVEAPSPRRTGTPGGCFQVRPQGDPKSWFDSMVAVVDFHRGGARTVRLHPLDLGDTCDQSRRGIPHLAEPAAARRILAELQRYSARFGTRIAVDGSIGTIDVPASDR